MENFEFGGEIVWWPTPAYTENSNLSRFMQRHNLSGFDDLIRRSTHDLSWFWNAVLEDLDIEFYEPYTQVLDISQGIQWPRWCIDGKMNIVHNCLDKWQGTPTQNRVALRWEGEEGQVRLLSYGDLNREVSRVANGLRALGIGKGDAIGLFMPMTPEIAIALLAIAKIGGVILPLFSGYGAQAIATRLADAEAKALFTSDGSFRRGSVAPMKAVADEAALNAPTLKHMIVTRRTGTRISMQEGRDIWWDELVENQLYTAPTEHTEAEDRLMIIYTSGTTGRPKGAVHTHCGFPIKAAQDMYHGFDLKPADTLYWMTDMGWMMGPWQVLGTLLLGATMVLYDGAPDYPDVDRLWELVERHGITVLGVSPTLIRTLMRHGDAPVRKHDISSLRITGSTGEPWNPAPWLWFFETVCQKRLPIINYSGGTEISGGIISGNVLSPLKPCAFSGPMPGMAVDVVDDHGNSVRGQVGELVIRQPWIGMTRGFWKDTQRYLDTYWSRFENVWLHGDWAAIDEDGLWYILGRSDDTIKVAGKRLGPAEVESILVSHPAVSEAAVIGIPDELKGQAVVCFCVLKHPASASSELGDTLKDLVAAQLGKPLKPKEIRFVPDLPKTRNAKVMRRVLRSAYLGEPAGDLTALVNPEIVELIQKEAR